MEQVLFIYTERHCFQFFKECDKSLNYYGAYSREHNNLLASRSCPDKAPVILQKAENLKQRPTAAIQGKVLNLRKESKQSEKSQFLSGHITASEI